MNKELFTNKNFELVGELTKDLEAALIARNEKLTLKDKLLRLQELKPSCSEKIQNGIETFVEEKEESLKLLDELLKNGYSLLPEVVPVKTSYPLPYLVESLEQLKTEKREIRFSLIKNETLGLNQRSPYGRVWLNENNELLNLTIAFEKVGKSRKKEENPLFTMEINLKHKFNRFDIITVPYIDEYMVVIDKEDAEREFIEVDKGPYCMDLYCARLANGWDYGHDVFFNHLTKVHALEPYFEKINYDDAPADIRKLVDYLKENKQKSSKEA